MSPDFFVTYVPDRSADWNLITAQSGETYFDPIRQAKYCAGAAIELLDEADRLGREHAKYERLLLQASEILQEARHSLFWHESIFAEPFIEARALRRNSAKATKARHANNELMKRHALELRDANRWPSRRQAAKAITPKVRLYAEELGTRVSEDRIEQTVYEWFTEEDKKRASAR